MDKKEILSEYLNTKTNTDEQNLLISLLFCNVKEIEEQGEASRKTWNKKIEALREKLLPYVRSQAEEKDTSIEFKWIFSYILDKQKRESSGCEEKPEILISNFHYFPETKKDGILAGIVKDDFAMQGGVICSPTSKKGLRVEVINLPVQICLQLNPSLLPEIMSDFALFFSYESRDIGTFNLIFQDFEENQNYKEIGKESIGKEGTGKANLGAPKEIQILNLPTRFVRIVFEPLSLGTFFITNMRLVRQKGVQNA